MQPAPNIEQSSAAQVLIKLLLLMNRNAQTWEDSFAEDAVFETLYASRTSGRKIGKAAVSHFIKNALFPMQDLSWLTTGGGQLDGIFQLMHEFMDKMLMPALDQPKFLQTFAKVTYTLSSPTALFQPSILAQVLWLPISRFFSTHLYAVGDN